MSEQSVRLAINKPVMDWVWAVVQQICFKAAAIPGSVFSGGRGKTDPVVLARHAIALCLRGHIGSQRKGGAEYAVFADGLPDGWFPIGYPVLGELLGCVHSTFGSTYLKSSKIPERARRLLESVVIPAAPGIPVEILEHSIRPSHAPIASVVMAPAPGEQLTEHCTEELPTMPKIDGYHSTRGLHETHRDETPLTDGHDCV